MKLLRSDSTLVILLGLVALIALRGVTSGISFGMVIVFFALFGALKWIAGMKSWWHALLGGATASLLWIRFGDTQLSGISLAVLPAILAMIAAVSIVKVAFLVRRRQTA